MVKVGTDDIIIVNVGDNIEKLNARQFVRPVKDFAFLPYFSELEEQLDVNFQKIINGLVASILIENHDDVLEYAKQFKRYISDFGLRMNKKKCLDLVKFFYDSIVKEHQFGQIIKSCAECANSMLLKTRPHQFSSHDLLLDWRPLFDIYIRAYRSKIQNVDRKALIAPFFSFSSFFAPAEQPTIWQKILEYFHLQNHVGLFAELCIVFLSIDGLTTEEHKKYGCTQWFPVLWKIYLTLEMHCSYGILPQIFAMIVHIAPDAIDWSGFYDEMFTKVLRSFDVLLPDGKTFIGDGSETAAVTNFAYFLAYSIGGPNSSLYHFERTMKCIEFSLHPLNCNGEHLENIEKFLQVFLNKFTDRFRRERLKSVKRAVPEEYYLKDEEVDKVAELVVDALMMMIFSYGATYEKVADTLYNLMSLNVNVVGPKILNQMYSATFAVSHSDRLSTAMDSIASVIFQIVHGPDDENKPKNTVKCGLDWIERIEKERMNWPSFVEGSQMKNEMKKEAFGTLKHHTIYMFEMFVNYIDINDVGRAESALTALLYMFSSFPIMDFSEAAVFHGDEMTEEDKILCKLSKRIPMIAEVALDKILKVISCLAISTPNDSCSLIASMNDLDASPGEDEEILMESISLCVTAIFTHADAALTQKLSKKLFQFAFHTVLANSTATDLLSRVVGSCISVDESLWMEFATFIHRKLKELLTEETRKMKDAPTDVIYYSSLAQALFQVTPNGVVENEKLIFEVIELLLGSQCKPVYLTAIKGMDRIPVYLTDIAPISRQESKELFRKPLSEWNPIKEWARCVKTQDMILKWHVPSTRHLACLQNFADKFFFPAIESLNNFERMSRDDLWKTTQAIFTMLMALMDVLKFPKHEEMKSTIRPNSLLPHFSNRLGGCEKTEWELLAPDGKTAREFTLARIEKLCRSSEKMDPKVLEIVICICVVLLFEGSLCKTRMETEDLKVEKIHSRLAIPIHGEMKKATFEAMCGFAAAKHGKVLNYQGQYYETASTYNVRILKIVFSLALNDYDVVRSKTQKCIIEINKRMKNCTEYIIDQLLAVITDPNVKNEQTIRGALATIINAFGTICSNVVIRSKTWKALLKLRVIDNPHIRTYFDNIFNLISELEDRPTKLSGDRTTYEQRTAQSYKSGLKLLEVSELEEWKTHLTEEGLKRMYFEHLKWEDEMNEARNELIDCLVKNHIQNSDHHHTRDKMARTMLYQSQIEVAKKGAIEVLLAQLVNEEEELRMDAVVRLGSWLKYNKPKVVKEVFRTPPLTDNGVEMECGIRLDNMFAVYDSKNLPNTEEKWNDMIFVEKIAGAYKLPSCINVVRKAKHGPAIEPRVLNEEEKTILKWFESEQNLEKWFSMRRKEKEDDSGCSAPYGDVIKYAIRNFPDSKKVLENFKKFLATFLHSKEKEEQKVAAEIMMGINGGIKHRSFKEVEEFWKWCAPEIDKFLDVFNFEAYGDWASVFVFELLDSNSDWRKKWWLVETLIEGAKRNHTQEWRSQLRWRWLSGKNWRYIEVVNRVCEIAWAKVPIAVTDTLRYAIAWALNQSAKLLEISWNNTHQGIEQRFVVMDTDAWIRRFIANIPQIQSKSYDRRLSKSDSELISKKEATSRKRKRDKSPDGENLEMAEKISLIYFRTLLEFLSSYYSGCRRSWTTAIIEIVPKLFEYADEESIELTEGTQKDLDITQESSILIEHMSSLWLSKKFMDNVLTTVLNTYSTNIYAWRVRVAVMKFLQAMVYSNIFGLAAQSRSEAITNIVFEAMSDPSITVRKEAARCLTFFINCEYVVLDDEKVEHLSQVLNDEAEAAHRKHGAALALGSVVTAFPFSLPHAVLKPLKVLSLTNTRLTIVKETVTQKLREFQQQHRDDWEKSKKVLGEQLVFEIENATAPVYYA